MFNLKLQHNIKIIMLFSNQSLKIKIQFYISEILFILIIFIIKYYTTSFNLPIMVLSI